MGKKDDSLSKSGKSKSDACVEKGMWTTPPAVVTNLVFTPQTSGAMTFHMVGCSGDPKRTGPGLAVGGGMASQIANPVSPAVTPSFFYHLGDIAYPTSGTTMSGDLWNTQFYNQYKAYKNASGPLPIFAIPGNHDGNVGSKPYPPDQDTDGEIYHYMQNMCGTAGVVSPDNQSGSGLTESTVPYVYWRLDTPLAWIIGLYTNVANGGILDDPSQYKDPTQGPQYGWLVDQLTWCKQQNAGGTPRAILLALHYPPYNGTIDFLQRGDPTLGKSPGASNAQPIGNVLQSAFTEAGQLPDAIFCAHAHLYQRITIAYPGASDSISQQIPCFIVGCGGHTQLEQMASECSTGTSKNFPAAPFDLFKQGTPPKTLSVPQNSYGKGTVTIEAYFDGSNQANQPYGFLTVTLTAGSGSTHPTLVCQFYTTPCDSNGNPVNPNTVTLTDSCTLDLTTHLLTQQGVS